MMTIRAAEDRGHADHGWLDSWHSFSFADYYDPRHMGFRALRVINEDRVAPGRGFGMHPHKEMEILSYVLEGALSHKDSMGTGSVIRAGDVQRMSAGTGVAHSEFNPSPAEPVHFLQIWLMPKTRGGPPSYEQKTFPLADARGLRVVASPDGREGSVVVNADAVLHAGVLRPGDAEAVVTLAPGRHAYVQVARGSAVVGGVTLKAGDGAAISEQGDVRVQAGKDAAEVLVFDLA